MPERAWQWQRRIGCGPDRFVPLDWGSELWNWDVSTFESADGIRVAKTRSGRAFDDDDVLAEATFTLLQDVVDAAGGLEAAYKRFGVAVASGRPAARSRPVAARDRHRADRDLDRVRSR